MSRPGILIDYDFEPNSMRFRVDPSDFRDMTADQIAEEIRDKVKEDAAANLEFTVTRIERAIADIQETLAEEDREEAEADEAEMFA